MHQKNFSFLPLPIKQEITGSRDYPCSYNSLNDENLSRGYETSSSKFLLWDLREDSPSGPEHERKIRWPIKTIDNVCHLVALL